MYTIHATQKLRDRVKAPLTEADELPSTAFGNWYVTALLWKPEVALLVNEGTVVLRTSSSAPAKSSQSDYVGVSSSR
jgi:hypothetical protein